MKVAIVVHGRFYAFDLARALIERGHDVKVFTNYPKWAARKFGLPSLNVESFWIHGVLARLVHKLTSRMSIPALTAFMHRFFGVWAAKKIPEERWDVVHVFSGVAEEVLGLALPAGTVKQLVRASSHIRVQDTLLREETQRVGWRIERPEPWMISREEREYAMADEIVVHSGFALESFLVQNVAPEKMRMLPLGVDTTRFQPASEVVEERCRRVRAREPLRVLMTGTLSFQKGVYDFAHVIRELQHEPFRFRFIGNVGVEATKLVSSLNGILEVIPRQPQYDLPRWYEAADLFVFPTIQDGFPVVLAQAHAAALPILTTTNCSGPDLIDDGKTGWVLPVRNAEAFIGRLRWCQSHRAEVAAMIVRIYRDFRPRDWDDVARDFEQIVHLHPEHQAG